MTGNALRMLCWQVSLLLKLSHMHLPSRTFSQPQWCFTGFQSMHTLQVPSEGGVLLTERVW